MNDRNGHGATVADVLERAAAVIDATPGTNVLDAQRQAVMELQAAGRLSSRDAVDQLAADTYYALLDYLPPHIELLGPWSDSETSDRVAGKLRQLAKTLRRGGPAHVDVPPPAKSETAVVDVASGRNKGATHHVRRGVDTTPKTPAAKLQHERGVVLAAITRAKRAAHPNAAKLTENELRLQRIDADLAALGLIAESQAFPAERVPVAV